MAKLVITMKDGNVHDVEITPRLEYNFEQHVGMGFHKALLELSRQSDIYWLAFEGLRLAGVQIKPMPDFLDLITKVDVLDSSPLA
jgi:hypothetical protein